MKQIPLYSYLVSIFDEKLLGSYLNCVSRNYDFSKRTSIGYIQSFKR